MRRLLRYLRPYRGRVALAVVLLLASALLQLIGPWLTKVALDRAIPGKDGALLAWLAAAYLGSLLAGFALEYLQTLLTTWLGQRVMYDLRRQIFGHLQRLSLPFFDRNPVGRLMTRVTNDVEVLNELFSSGVVTVFGDLFTLVFIIGAMLLMDWRLALVAMAVLPLVVLAAAVFRARIRDAYREIRIKLARINAFLQERITGVGVVQLFGRERDTGERFRAIDRDYLDAHLRSITYYALFFPVMELITAIALALLIAYGGREILEGTVTVGVIAAFLQYVRRFFQPIQDLSEKYNMLQGAMASSERIFKLLDTEPSVPEPAAPLRPPRAGKGEIEFRDVWFAYRKRDDGAQWDWVLKGVSFKVRAGERVALVGHTGAGKTTVINLLMRFYEPQAGEILFDGVPIQRVPLEELRSRVGLVLQDVFLFSRDLAYNIRLGRGDIDDARVRRAAARVGADRFIERLPQAYAHALGERGANLSVGERQLLSFARALAFDPLVLVLDEATSSVDSELEEQIQRALETLMRGRTSLVIAHRLSTVQNAHRILVLHHGELREEGTHAELLARGGLYARLHELQFAQPAAGVPQLVS
ncbi:MAG: ABC transporter ATP-binding protein [Gemmatimonadetes bacterium]|nr:ABC transporter ATP-binding protein [Gemmatimonadota bacterium]